MNSLLELATSVGVVGLFVALIVMLNVLYQDVGYRVLRKSWPSRKSIYGAVGKALALVTPLYFLLMLVTGGQFLGPPMPLLELFGALVLFVAYGFIVSRGFRKYGVVVSTPAAMGHFALGATLVWTIFLLIGIGTSVVTGHL